jgi:hypothetical protein
MKNYKQLIEENNAEFNDGESLTDFLENYCNDLNDKEWPTQVRDQEDNISEYADGLVPIYYADIVKEWQENGECKGMADDQGMLEETKDPYKIMQADLYCYYDNQLREDYNKLIELMDEQEDEETAEGLETEAIK